jgi:hypothetical protein
MEKLDLRFPESDKTAICPRFALFSWQLARREDIGWENEARSTNRQGQKV